MSGVAGGLFVVVGYCDPIMTFVDRGDNLLLSEFFYLHQEVFVV